MEMLTLSPQEQNFQIKNNDQMVLNNQDSDQNISCYGKFLNCIGDCCGFARTWMPCICCCFVDYPYTTIEQGSEGLFSKFGKYTRTVMPGLHYVNPCTQKLSSIDVRINVMDLDRQNVITKDNVRINIDCSVYYKVINSKFAQFRVNNFQHAIGQITYAIIKNTCGQFLLQEILEKRNAIANDIEKQVDDYTANWGIDVVDIFIKDIQLNNAAKERRLAESKMIIAKAEVQSAKLMRSAADCLNSPAAIQMRYLQTLKQMGTGLKKLIFVPKNDMISKVQHMITQGLIL